MGLKIQMAIKKNRLAIRLDGELDQSNVEEVKMKVCNIIKKYSVVHLVFNFENLSFMDSTGIGLLIGRYKKLNSIGVKSYIENPMPSVQRVLELSGLYGLMPKIG